MTLFPVIIISSTQTSKARKTPVIIISSTQTSKARKTPSADLVYNE
jgi:hypothetical protein